MKKLIMAFGIILTLASCTKTRTETIRQVVTAHEETKYTYPEHKPDSMYIVNHIPILWPHISFPIVTTVKGYELVTGYITTPRWDDFMSDYHEYTMYTVDFGTKEYIDSIKCIRYSQLKAELIVLEELNKPCNN